MVPLHGMVDGGPSESGMPTFYIGPGVAEEMRHQVKRFICIVIDIEIALAKKLMQTKLMFSQYFEQKKTKKKTFETIEL